MSLPFVCSPEFDEIRAFSLLMPKLAAKTKSVTFGKKLIAFSSAFSKVLA